ncbi:MAG: OmpH family outer membrane protein, partial [Pseudodonghicola sp.]
LRAARPVLETLMRETGAGVILERNSVFLSANATDITDEAIARIDAAIGDGAQTAEPHEQ